MVHILQQNGLLSHEKNEIMPFEAPWMDLEIVIRGEVRQRQYHVISLTCRIENMTKMNFK